APAAAGTGAAAITSAACHVVAESDGRELRCGDANKTDGMTFVATSKNTRYSLDDAAGREPRRRHWRCRCCRRCVSRGGGRRLWRCWEWRKITRRVELVVVHVAVELTFVVRDDRRRGRRRVQRRAHGGASLSRAGRIKFSSQLPSQNAQQ